MNATLQKFGYPDTCVWQGSHWAILLRPQQVTLGALVLATLSDAASYSQLSAAALDEHGKALQRCEKILTGFRPYEKINFLTLMMVDPHVHTHVLPRYATAQTYAGLTFTDAGWPGPPDLKAVTPTTDVVRTQLLADLMTVARGLDVR